jgi:hypothetical protein
MAPTCRQERRRRGQLAQRCCGACTLAGSCAVLVEFWTDHFNISIEKGAWYLRRSMTDG